MEKQKKTIFMTVNRAIIVRNIILNPAFQEFASHYRIVLFSPQFEDKQLKEMCSNCKIEQLFERKLTPFQRKLEQLFISLHKSLIYNPTIQVCSEYGLMLRNPVRFKRLRNNIEKYFLGRFLSHEPVRRFFKWMDRKIFPCNLYDDVIDTYKPDAVFVTAIGSDDEIAFLRNCKAKGVKSIGMAMSWDNLSKSGFREKTDHFILWSDYMKEEALRFQGYQENELTIVGIPQFDNYVGESVEDKKTFFQRFGLDPQKKTIFFGSEGPVCPDDPYIVSFLATKIKDGTLSEYQILVRPHFAYKKDIERFLPFVDKRYVFVDSFYGSSQFKDGTSLDLSTVKNLSLEIQYSDVSITSTSTLVLDILANGRLPLLYNFDKDKTLHFRDSIRRLYDTLWFREIRAIGLDNMANSEEELVSKIKEFAQNPEKEEKKRSELIERFCYQLDGKSGKRLFECLRNFFEK